MIGTQVRASAAEAAFANAVLGHGLVREDMHTGSVSHLGIVIFPTLLALSQTRKVAGRDFIAGAVCGYEIGASVGRALMDQETVRIFRPTGITGPLGAAVAGSRMLGFTEDAGVSALGLAANSTAGLNEWPASGADDMFFHAGFAARNAVTAVELAELGAFGSETALDGPAGLFAALRHSDRVEIVTPFPGETLRSSRSITSPRRPVTTRRRRVRRRSAHRKRVDSQDITGYSSKVHGRGDQLSGLQRLRSVPARLTSQDEHPLLRRGDAGAAVDRREQLPASRRS